MMNQETYVKVHDLHKQGWTIDEIAAETGFHPATICKHLKARAAAGDRCRRGVGDERVLAGTDRRR